MCMACSDFVDKCYDCNRMHFLGDTFCEHLTEKHGTEKTYLYDHVYFEHDPQEYPDTNLSAGFVVVCDDDCIREGWYSLEEIERVSRKVYPDYGPEGL